MPLPAPVTIATFPVALIFAPVSLVSVRSAHAGELPGALDFARDALEVFGGAPARVSRRGLVGQRRAGDVLRQPLARLGVRVEQPVERVGGQPVVEVVLPPPLLGADRSLSTRVGVP